MLYMNMEEVNEARRLEAIEGRKSDLVSVYLSDWTSRCSGDRLFALIDERNRYEVIDLLKHLNAVRSEKYKDVSWYDFSLIIFNAVKNYKDENNIKFNNVILILKFLMSGALSKSWMSAYSHTMLNRKRFLVKLSRWRLKWAKVNLQNTS